MSSSISWVSQSNEILRTTLSKSGVDSFDVRAFSSSPAASPPSRKVQAWKRKAFGSKICQNRSPRPRANNRTPEEPLSLPFSDLLADGPVRPSLLADERAGKLCDLDRKTLILETDWPLVPSVARSLSRAHAAFLPPAVSTSTFSSSPSSGCASSSKSVNEFHLTSVVTRPALSAVNAGSKTPFSDEDAPLFFALAAAVE